jgi:(p)ppGpp synthase/HD superfamily hydrolase
VERKEVVAKLKGLREEFEKDGISILDVPTTMAMALSDVCDALGLSQAEHDEVVGEEVAQAVEEWKSARMWQPAERETATESVKELVAVPA